MNSNLQTFQSSDEDLRELQSILDGNFTPENQRSLEECIQGYEGFFGHETAGQEPNMGNSDPQLSGQHQDCFHQQHSRVQSVSPHGHEEHYHLGERPAEENYPLETRHPGQTVLNSPQRLTTSPSHNPAGFNPSDTPIDCPVQALPYDNPAPVDQRVTSQYHNPDGAPTHLVSDYAHDNIPSAHELSGALHHQGPRRTSLDQLIELGGMFYPPGLAAAAEAGRFKVIDDSPPVEVRPSSQPQLGTPRVNKETNSAQGQTHSQPESRHPTPRSVRDRTQSASPETRPTGIRKRSSRARRGSGRKSPVSSGLAASGVAITAMSRVEPNCPEDARPLDINPAPAQTRPTTHASPVPQINPSIQLSTPGDVQSLSAPAASQQHVKQHVLNSDLHTFLNDVNRPYPPGHHNLQTIHDIDSLDEKPTRAWQKKRWQPSRGELIVEEDTEQRKSGTLKQNESKSHAQLLRDAWEAAPTKNGILAQGFDELKSKAAPPNVSLAIFGNMPITAMEFLIFFPRHVKCHEAMHRLLQNGWTQSDIANCINWSRGLIGDSRVLANTLLKNVQFSDKKKYNERKRLGARDHIRVDDMTMQTYTAGKHDTNIIDFPIVELVRGVVHRPTGSGAHILTKLIEHCERQEPEALLSGAESLAIDLYGDHTDIPRPNEENPDVALIGELKETLDRWAKENTKGKGKKTQRAAPQPARPSGRKADKRSKKTQSQTAAPQPPPNTVPLQPVAPTAPMGAGLQTLATAPVFQHPGYLHHLNASGAYQPPLQLNPHATQYPPVAPQPAMFPAPLPYQGYPIPQRMAAYPMAPNPALYYTPQPNRMHQIPPRMANGPSAPSPTFNHALMPNLGLGMPQPVLNQNTGEQNAPYPSFDFRAPPPTQHAGNGYNPVRHTFVFPEANQDHTSSMPGRWDMLNSAFRPQPQEDQQQGHGKRRRAEDDIGSEDTPDGAQNKRVRTQAPAVGNAGQRQVLNARRRRSPSR